MLPLLLVLALFAGAMAQGECVFYDQSEVLQSAPGDLDPNILDQCP
jgi:hypothetical protein